MALTTTQVNQAFLATLGRPAEGSAAAWGSTALDLGALLDGIFIAGNTDGDFVEYLYQQFLGRASDAEGKAFWNTVLANTSKGEVLAQFKAAVLAGGQADPSNADFQNFIAINKAFVGQIYTNLLGREADAEGLEFWTNALTSGTSRGELLSQIVAAVQADPNSDDAQTLNAKLSVADAFSAAFNDFSKDVTADGKQAAFASLVEQMNNVVAGSTVEEFQDAINLFKGQNQDRKTDIFTKADNDDLDASESTAATTFRGTINISDNNKSTIQAGDTATGNSDFAPANTLIVDVKSDGKEKDFKFDRDMKATINNVDNLTINNGTADVTLKLDGTTANFSGKVAIAGKGDTANVTVAQDVESLSVSTSGTKKAYADTTVTATLGSFEGSAAKDALTISGTIAKSINTGDGKDNVTLEATAKVFEKATINLGAGDDTLTINTSDIGNYNADGVITENLKASVTIDGGNGKDTLELSKSIDYVSSIVNVENIKATDTAAISAVAADGLKTTVSGDLTINASYNNIKSIDLRGIKSEKDTDTLKLSGVTYENITLSSNIKETIQVKAHTADDKKSYAEISKFGADDKISVGSLTAAVTVADSKDQDLTNYNDVASLLLGKTGAVAINDVAGKKSYIWQTDGLTTPKLVAIVDKKLKVDADTKNFVLDANTTTTKPASGVTTNVFDYNPDVTTLDLANGKYGQGTKAPTFTSPIAKGDSIAINNVKGEITITDSGKASLGTVKLFALDGTKLTGAGDTYNKIDVYLGGYYDETAGKIVADDTITLASSNNFDTKAANVYYNAKELKGAFANFTKAVDLKGTGSDDIAAKVTITDAGIVVADNVDIDAKFANATANDTITYTLATSTATGAATVKTTTAADVITLQKTAQNKAVTIDLMSDSAIDSIDAKANVIDTDLSGILTIKNASSGDSITFVSSALANATLTKVEVASAGSDLKGAMETALKAGGSSIAANTLFLVDVKASDTASQVGQYLVYNKSSDATITDNEDIVMMLSGNVNVEIGADKLGVVFA